MEKRYALIKGGVVETVTIGDENYVPPSGYTALPSDTANIGDTYVDGKFIQHVAPLSKAELTYAAEVRLVGLSRLPHEFALSDGTKVVSDCRVETRGDLRDLASWGAAHPEATRVWQDSSGNRITLTGAQFVEFSAKVSDAYMILFDMLDELKQAISAGTVISPTQFDQYIYVADVVPGTF